MHKHIEITITNGRALARIPLGRRQDLKAEIWLDDYERLLALGLSPTWNRVGPKHYVTVTASRAKGAHILVARVLLDAGVGQSVRYIDGNPLNLRRENLELIDSSMGIRRDREYLRKKEVSDA